MRSLLLAALVFACLIEASAAELKIDVEIPRLDVAEYHRPYIAVWIEHPDQRVARHLAVWYQTDAKKEDGRQWLKDLRQWWRRGGRSLEVPIDGMTGATRPVGQHTLSFKDDGDQLQSLAPGKYNVVIEAVREVGGRELLRLPLEWPATNKQQSNAKGASELGAVSLTVTP